MRAWGMLLAFAIGLTGVSVADPLIEPTALPVESTAPAEASAVPQNVATPKSKIYGAHACNPSAGPGIIDGHLSPEPGSGAYASLLLLNASEASNAYLRSVKASIDHFEQMVAYFRDPRLRSAHPMQLMALLESMPPSFESKVDPAERQEMWSKAKVTRVDEEGKFLCEGMPPGSYYLLLEVRKEIETPRYMAKLTSAVRLTQKSYYAMEVSVPSVPPTQRVLVRARHFALLGQEPPGDTPPPGSTPAPR